MTPPPVVRVEALPKTWSQHLVAVGALVANLAVCTVVSAKVFPWE